MRTRFRRLVAVLCVCAIVPPATAATNPTPAPAAAPVTVPRLTLDDLFAEPSLVDAAIAPGGGRVAMVWRTAAADEIHVRDLATGETTAITRIARKPALPYITMVQWKTDDRLLFRTSLYDRGQDVHLSRADRADGEFGSRVYAIDRTGDALVKLLDDKRDRGLYDAIVLGRVASFLPTDPAHVLMFVEGGNGPGLFRADINTGRGEVVAKSGPGVIGWWVDRDARPVMRLDYRYGALRFMRQGNGGKWKEFHRIRPSETEEQIDYTPIGPSDRDGMYYVLARPPGRDRVGVYLYDLVREDFGEPVVEDAVHDIEGAAIADDGSGVVAHCHVTHVRVCESSDKVLNAHLRGLRRFFADTANVYLSDVSADRNTLLVYVEGPADPPAYYYYRLDARHIEYLGPRFDSLAGRALPEPRVVNWTARDGLALSGYLSLPPGASGADPLPLVVLPHGGPERRDQFGFDPWVQYLAARGYAVFQPNFRGSSGFGQAFAERGYGQWGGAMQTDIDDGLAHLVGNGIVDASRVCIVGASYGGYAALAGVALAPGKYRCAVALAGVSDLVAFAEWRRERWGKNSEGYAYSLRSIGDPQTDAARLAATSPARLAASIREPVLLLHGVRDGVVPVEQSRLMQAALLKAGRPVELIEVQDEGHAGWSEQNQRSALAAIAAFLQKHLGPGAGAASAAAPAASRS